MKITGNEPSNTFFHDGGDFKMSYPGLTIRQQFAMAAMQGWIACQHEGFTGSYEVVAENAINNADALIKALNETPNPNS